MGLKAVGVVAEDITAKVRDLAVETMQGKFKGSADLSEEILKRMTPEEMSHVVVNYIMDKVTEQDSNPLASLMSLLSSQEEG